MAKGKRRRQNGKPRASLWRSDLGRRFIGLIGLGAIVAVVIAVLAATGLFGSQGGGTVTLEEQTETGETIVREVTIEDAEVFDPPAPPGVTDFNVGTTIDKFAKDFEVSRLDTGERVKLSDFRGQPVFLNFWASWCIPCRVEMPDIDQLMKNHPELVVIGINRGEPIDRAQGFLDSIELNDGTKGLRFTVPVMDPNDKLYNEFRGLGMPVSLFIDASGKITQVHNGLLRLPQMEEFFAEALASAPVSSADMTETAPAQPGS